MIAQLVAHRHLAAIITIVAVFAGCHGGVDVSIVGIPADTQVSVDSLSQDTAAAPSKVYRYNGIGYARVMGLVPAPSYTATARDGSGCIKATASVDYDGSDEVHITLRPVEGCGNLVRNERGGAIPRRGAGADRRMSLGLDTETTRW